jgi:hypothetical protein
MHLLSMSKLALEQATIHSELELGKMVYLPSTSKVTPTTSYRYNPIMQNGPFRNADMQQKRAFSNFLNLLPAKASATPLLRWATKLRSHLMVATLLASEAQAMAGT